MYKNKLSSKNKVDIYNEKKINFPDAKLKLKIFRTPFTKNGIIMATPAPPRRLLSSNQFKASIWEAAKKKILH